MGEHLVCNQGVVGSSPITSIVAELGAWGLALVMSSQWKSEFRRGLLIFPEGGMTGWPVVSVRVTGRVVFVSVNQVLVRLWACCQGGVVHNRFLRSREV